jgi:ubiquinone/menaquinone biosynthesis C-methylase UbiE
MNAHPSRSHGEVLRETLSLSGLRVLDIGCGDGTLVRSMTRAGARATGLEISEGKLARARAAEPAGQEDYRVGRGEALPFSDALFDLAIFFNSLHHVPVTMQDAAPGEAARVLAPGGLLYVVEPLCEGALFALMRPVDDETGVRGAAYSALQRAVAGGTFTQLRECTYDSPYTYASFDDLKDRMLAVDEARRAAFEAHESGLRAQFERGAVRTEQGFVFTHPNRLNLFQRL